MHNHHHFTKSPVEQTRTTVETANQLSLLEEEFEKIKSILGRTPNFTELSIFSVMWSEHCGYKNSKPLLRLFPSTGAHVLTTRGGENAGALIGIERGDSKVAGLVELGRRAEAALVTTAPVVGQLRIASPVASSYQL